MIRLNCFFQAGDGDHDYKDAMRAATTLAVQSRKHPGCIAYDVYVSTTRSDVFMICETWADQASLDKHTATADFKRYAKEMTDRGQLKIERFEF